MTCYVKMSQMLTISRVELYMYAWLERTHQQQYLGIHVCLSFGVYRVSELLSFEISQYIIFSEKTNYK